MCCKEALDQWAKKDHFLWVFTSKGSHQKHLACDLLYTHSDSVKAHKLRKSEEAQAFCSTKSFFLDLLQAKMI